MIGNTASPFAQTPWQRGNEWGIACTGSDIRLPRLFAQSPWTAVVIVNECLDLFNCHYVGQNMEDAYRDLCHEASSVLEHPQLPTMKRDWTVLLEGIWLVTWYSILSSANGKDNGVVSPLWFVAAMVHYITGLLHPMPNCEDAMPALLSGIPGRYLLPRTWESCWWNWILKAQRMVSMLFCDLGKSDFTSSLSKKCNSADLVLLRCSKHQATAWLGYRAGFLLFR